MNAILAMALKDIRLLTRDRVGLFFVIGFPFVYALFIGSIFSTGSGGGGGSFTVAVTDEDNTDASRAFIAKLDGNKSVEVVAATRADAETQVRRSQAAAYLVIPAGFGASRANPFAGGDRPALQLGADPGRVAETAMLEGALLQIGFESIGDLMMDTEARTGLVREGLESLSAASDNPAQATERTQRFIAALKDLDELTRSVNSSGEETGGVTAMLQPIAIEKTKVARQRRGPDNAFEFSFPQGIAWAFLFCVTRFGASLVAERVRGTLVRMQVAPLSRWHIIGGKALACVMVMIVVGGALSIFATQVLDVHIRSLPLFALAAICAILCFTGIMVLISTLGQTEEAAAGIGSAVMLVITMLGGGAVPLLAMPPWMQSLASVSPVKWAILALEGAIWRGFTLSEMITPCLILVAVGATCFIIGTRAFRWHAA